MPRGELFPPPAFRECRHRSFARRLIAVSWAAVFVLRERPFFCFLWSKRTPFIGSISRLSGWCDGVRTMLRKPFLYFVRVNSLIRPNDAINGMALK